MEGDTVQYRPLFHLLRNLPTPLRWLVQEFVRFVHWLDHRAARLMLCLRSSPAWSFVTMMGVIGVGLTVLLFISAIEQHSVRGTHPTSRVIVSNGRAHLEKNHEWSAQDRWRIAHLFVPNKPSEPFKNIQIDSRLMNPGADTDPRNDRGNSQRSESPQPRTSGKDFEVRLDLRRPSLAEEGTRLIAESPTRSRGANRQIAASQIHRRNPRLLVQAEWEFSADCQRDDYASLPPQRPRRVIPVPMPEPRTEPRPIAAPDLSFEIAMVRHFMTSAPFPPGSHLVSQSDRSAFPIDDPRFQNELVSYGDRLWERSDRARIEARDEAIEYTGVGRIESDQATEKPFDEIDPTLSSVTEIGMQLELVFPRIAVGGMPNESKLIIRNLSPDSIPRVEVQDLISESEKVIDASPDASIEIVDTGSGLNKLYHRELQGMPSGDEQEFSLRWIPERGHRNHLRTRVIAQAAVSAATEVEPPEPDQQMPSIPPEPAPDKHPALAFDIDYPEEVAVGNEVELKIRVRNTGDTTLHDVKLRIELPSQLSHPDGKEVVFDVGKLLVHGQAQTILKVSASQIGDATNILQASSAEHIRARGKASILVVERPSEPAPLVPIPETLRPKPQVSPAPVRPSDRAPAKPAERCCCQRTPSVLAVPAFQFP